ncbi:MAG TPA: hypothetical protein PLD40_05690 [Kiritimatiellia bacterium]|jgi:hypothetical protein|nr:hypothetical protein [Kiritimatiellia bacterium]OQC57914.1 MAG: hypothetical protein BWX54_01073 [Verrucomicrobia bacterium ADurb.Bin018]MBP9572550.1 hypothetical protein [Kiritimatiellia bacterium]HOE00441.1 hypothetical protein [Kiritimatiellia bacterium]HOU59095.1 hypothetical protein [Kiritimatiellia bacterium]
MKQLREAVTRERRAPIYWWFALLALTAGGLLFAVWRHTPHGALMLGILVVAAWAAPLVALHSLAAPRRPARPCPAPGTGSFREWQKQARLLGQLLLYYGDVPDLPNALREALYTARADLRDTLRAHPLRDDLERVCARIRAGAVREVKAWFAREYSRDIRALADEYEQTYTVSMDPDRRLLALQNAVEKAAAMMTRNCMPRMLERERLACATQCAWLAVQGAAQQGRVSPVDLAEMLVIEWSDFTEPWQPAQALARAVARLEPATDTTPAPEPAVVLPPTIKRYRRVRVRSRHRRPRHSHRRNRGPGIGQIMMSFGQWLRYSFRSWFLYR